MTNHGGGRRLPRISLLPPFRLAVVVCVAAFLFSGCRKKAEASPPPRYAVIRFENLSGDPGLDWLGRAISESLPVSLAGRLDGPVLGSAALGRLSPMLGPRPVSAPGESSERMEALGAAAGRIISGYVERDNGQIRISATEEDLVTGKSRRTVTAIGSSPGAVLDQLAHAFSPNAGPGLTANADALHAYAAALESAPDQRRVDLARAIQLDSGFGRAWVALVAGEIARGDRAAAESAISQARRQKIDSVSAADLDLADANLKGDRTASIAAMRKVSELSPADMILLRGLAEAETAAGDFIRAASDWRKVTAALPNDALAWNSLGYSRSYAGDYDGALAGFREYERLRPKDANPSDSIGDLDYSFGKYGAAADSYLEANKKQPGFEQFADLYKAAWAKFRAGDKPGADALFSQFRAERNKAPNPLFGLTEADWLYRTGRAGEAIALLRKLVSDAGTASVRMDAYSQLTIWDLLQGDRAQASKDAAAIGPTTSSPAVFMARFAALPSADAAEWEARAERLVPPSLAGLRRLAVAYALLLDNKRQEALPAWGEIVKSASATDFFSRAVYDRLQGKPAARPLLPDAAALNQFMAILDKL